MLIGTGWANDQVGMVTCGNTICVDFDLGDLDYNHIIAMAYINIMVFLANIMQQ